MDIGQNTEKSPGDLKRLANIQTPWNNNNNNNKSTKKNSRIMDFAVSVDHRIKLKESEKRNKYLDLAQD